MTSRTTKVLYTCTVLTCTYGTVLESLETRIECTTTITKTPLDDQNENVDCSTTTPSTTTREEPKQSANIREVENAVAAKFASIAENCGGTTVTDHLF